MENTNTAGELKESTNNKMPLETKMGWIVLAVIIISVIGYFGYGLVSAKGAFVGNAIQSRDVQIVHLKTQGSSYILEPSAVKKGIPVRIEADMSQMPGCSSSVVISAFGIRKSLLSSDNKIEFTPDKAGTFNIACSMNMYKGTFTVLEADGTKANYVEAAPTGGCGGSSGGCGGGCSGGCGV